MASASDSASSASDSASDSASPPRRRRLHHHTLLQQIRAFQALDVNGDGAISHDDLSHAIASSSPSSSSSSLSLLTIMPALRMPEPPSHARLLPRPSDVPAMIAAADLDGNGTVDLAEFRHQLDLVHAEERRERHEPPFPSSSSSSFPSAVGDMFRVLDADKDGFLCREDMRAAMAMCGEKPSEAELDAMIAAGACGGAALDFNAFSRLLLTLA